MVEKKIIINGVWLLSEEDGQFVNDKNLSSDDMLRVFKIVAMQVLGIKIVKWHYDCEKCLTTIWLE